jgi:hypothetical protein
MPLADDIQSLRDRPLTELKLAYDYYEDTKTAWGIVHQYIAQVTT